MSQLNNAVIIWLEESSIEALYNVDINVQRVIAIKNRISQREKEIKTIDDQPLFMFTDEFEDELIKEEKRREIKELNKILKDKRVRNLVKLDVPSLRTLGKLIDSYIERKHTFEDPIMRKFRMTPAEIEEYDREKADRLNAMKFFEKRRLNNERVEAKFNPAERIKQEKQESFNKLKNDLLSQIERTPYRKSPFNFVEPMSGCHYDIGSSLGHVVIPIPQIHINDPAYDATASTGKFLDDIHEYTYHITEQLFDNLGGKIDIQIITVEKWENSHYDTITGESYEEEQIRIHNTKFYSILARSEIMNACDNITKKLGDEYAHHNKDSNLTFISGLVMKLQYRVNRSTQKTSRKKYKGGAYIDHLEVPCFTNKLRTTCITRMNNYNIHKEDTYIYNIVNPNDNLCFLRYVILIKFLSVVKQREYLKTFHLSKLFPTVNPDNLGVFIPFIPFVRYPSNENTINPNHYSEEILKKHFPGLNYEEALSKVDQKIVTREYMIDCHKFMSWLNTTNEMSFSFPVNADDAHLIEQFETLNNITINIYTLDKEAYEPEGTKKLHELWTANI